MIHGDGSRRLWHRGEAWRCRRSLTGRLWHWPARKRERAEDRRLAALGTRLDAAERGGTRARGRMGRTMTGEEPAGEEIERLLLSRVTPGEAARWLETPNAALGGETPAALIGRGQPGRVRRLLILPDGAAEGAGCERCGERPGVTSAAAPGGPDWVCAECDDQEAARGAGAAAEEAVSPCPAASPS